MVSAVGPITAGVRRRGLIFLCAMIRKLFLTNQRGES